MLKMVLADDDPSFLSWLSEMMRAADRLSAKVRGDR